MVAAGVDVSRGATDLGVPTRGRDTARFLWDGMDWSPEIFLARSIWLLLAAAIALSAALPFDRFDPARRRAGKLRKKTRSSDSPGFLQRLSETVTGTSESRARGTAECAEFAANTGLLPLTQHGTRGRLWPLLVAELRLTVRGQKWWWFVVALGLVIASLFSPKEVVHRYLFPAAWLWPTVCWSALGNREARYRTAPVVFSTPHLVRRQLLATWLGGLLLAVATGSGAGLRLIIAGQWGHVLGFGVAATFIPSLALALGVWSGGGRLFEVLYVLWWYLGSIDRVPALDYMGIGSRSVSDGNLVAYFVVSVLLCCAAAVGRRRQMQT